MKLGCLVTLAVSQLCSAGATELSYAALQQHVPFQSRQRLCSSPNSCPLVHTEAGEGWTLSVALYCQPK